MRKPLNFCKARRRYFLNLIYARKLGAAPGFLRVTGKCDLRIEGRCSIGKGLYIRSRNHNRVEISVLKEGHLEIGEHVFINQGARIVAAGEVVIGNNVLIGDEVIILDADFHGVGERPAKVAPVRIEDDVWIASRAIILKGVVIGRGSVIGAGAVVTKSVPPESFVSGPAATVKTSRPV